MASPSEDIAVVTSPLRGEVDAQRRVRGATVQARSLRRNETEAEHHLWAVVRARRLEGHKFVRQLQVGPYIADFACREAALILEVDGSRHLDSPRDEVRTRYLNAQGYSVLRIWSSEVLANRAGVAEAILAALGGHPSPGPRFAPATLSPEGRGVKGTSAATAKARSRRLSADIPRLNQE